MSAVLRARAVLAAALLVAGCSFDPSGTLAEGGDAGPGPGVDAMRASSDRDPIESGDGGPGADGGAAGVDAAAPAIDAMEPPPDAEPDGDACGGFGQDCCDEGDACGGLLVCVGGTCI